MKIRNLNLFKALVVLLCGTTACNRDKKQQDTVQPNIIYIMTDDHAYQAIICYNGKLNQTPNIGRVANEGVIFTRSFVTNSICAPTFLELAGVEIPDDTQGKSIVPFM